MPHVQIDMAEVSLDSLAKANDGEYDAYFKQQIRRIVEHCKDMPLLDKERKVVLEISAVPVVDTSSHTPRCDQVKASLKLKATLPPLPLRTLDVQVRQQQISGKDTTVGAIAIEHAHDAKQSEISDLKDDAE
ncbi:MAG: hypothetical protein AAGD32_17410 [Planctomycetota bacterium]